LPNCIQAMQLVEHGKGGAVFELRAMREEGASFRVERCPSSIRCIRWRYRKCW
jgi:hypothetical protein